MSNPEESVQDLNAEIEDLYAEVEELHQQTETLRGLIAGGYAYFLHQLILGHQRGRGLSAPECEQIVLDALQRIQATQSKFEVDVLAEIQTVLQKMSQPTTLVPYTNRAFQERDR